LGTLRATFSRLIDRLRQECVLHYGDRLVSLVLYGSTARGTMGPDSDIDVLIVAEPLPEGRMPRMREFDVVEEILAGDLAQATAQGVHTFLAPVFKTPTEVQRGSPLFLDMTLEARILFDRNEFFARCLEGLRARLRRLGSRRVPFGGGYYWVLKPDLKPGEEIEL
jgi:predicted nucleotidyltransferase